MGSYVRYQIALTEASWSQLTNLLDESSETAGVLTARLGVSSDTVTFLGRTVHLVPENQYSVRESNRLSILSPGYVPALGRAADDGAAAVFFHTHPRSNPEFSVHDDLVDRQLREVFIRRTRHRYYVSLVIAGSRKSPSFSARVYTSEGPIHAPVDRLRIVGDRIRFLESGQSENETSHQFDRQVRAFGETGQRLLSRLHVGIVGAGGTGSAVCEQILRLGVGNVTIIDDDVVEDTNLTRIHEAHRADLGRPKVALFATAADAIGIGSHVRPIQAKLQIESSVRLLTGCDVVFGCTDDMIGRGILSRLAYWYLIPVFDTGFIIDSQQGEIRGLFGRVTTLVPESACLLCRGRITPQQIYYESLTPAERGDRVRQGYAPELGEPAPSVVTYTTLVGALAVAELLDRLFGIGSAPPPSELVLRVGERSISRTSTKGRPQHFCMDATFWGLGDQNPMLGLAWPDS
jgi:molybdopterin/thiamine biosynthesis adenylyltransferase